jgi:hypothetical protein
MTEPEERRPSGEDEVDESGRNPTQRRIDAEDGAERPVDEPWPETEEDEQGSR